MLDKLDGIQTHLFNRAKQFFVENSKDIDSLEAFNAYFEGDGGFASCYALDDPSIESYLKPLKVSARCIPLNQDNAPGKCIFTGKTVPHKTVFAKSY